LAEQKNLGEGRAEGEAKSEVNGHDRLIDCALASFAMWGFETATVRKIAAMAQVDPTLINYHFGSKLGLWKAVVDRIATQVEIIVERFALAGSAGELIDELVDAVCAHPDLAFFLIKEVSRQTDRFDYFYKALVVPLRDKMVPILKRETGNEDDDIRQAELLHFTLMGAIVMALVTRSFGTVGSDADDDRKFRAELQNLLRKLVE